MKAWERVAATALGVACVGLLVYGYDFGLRQRFEKIETLRAGVPYTEYRARGYVPYVEGEAVYLGRKVRFARFRSSGTFGARSLDFGLLINEAGIVEVVYPLSTDEGREGWRALTGDR